MSFISPRRHMGSYQAVDTVSRVEGASPHQLVVILFDELLLRLDAAIRHAQRGEAVPMIQARARARPHLSRSQPPHQRCHEPRQGRRTDVRAPDARRDRRSLEAHRAEMRGLPQDYPVGHSDRMVATSK